jgi:glycosyltransferase involved in cell wall biosynthesis
VPPAGGESESIFDDLLAALSKSSDTSAETSAPSPSFESLFEADEPEGPAPAVVAVMVAHNPGGWFEETLSSLGAQDYSALSVLVIDAASTDGVELRDRVGAVLPDAHLRRLPENSGYAAAANEALVAVQGAAFYLFCHDDVRLDPDAVRLLVEDRMPESSDPNSLSGVSHDGCSQLVWVLIGLVILRLMSNEATSIKSNTTRCATCFSFLER